MDFEELAAKRYSVRAYKPDPVELEKLNKVLEAARLAPTAANRQAFQLIVIHTKGKEIELAKVYGRPWFVQPPLIIAACGLPQKNWIRRDGQNYTLLDVGIMMDHVLMAATSLGLGTCWVAGFDVPAAREYLGLPADVEPIAFTPLGYPADQLGMKKRKDLSELVRYEHW